MKRPKLGRNKLLARMILTLLPAGALPLFCFGYFAITSHFGSLRDESFSNHKNLVSFMRGHLENDAARVLSQLKIASENEVFKTANQFQIREALQSFRAFNVDLAAVYFLAADGTVAAVDPPRPEVEGKRIGDLDLAAFRADGAAVSAVIPDEAGFPRFFSTRKILGEGAAIKGYIVADAALSGWIKTSRAILRNQRDMVAALLPIDGKGVPINLERDGDQGKWRKIAAVRLKASEVGEVMIGDELHHVTFQELSELPARLVVAQPMSSIYAAPRLVVMTYVGVIALLFVMLSVLIILIARGITQPIRNVAEAAVALAEGSYEERAPIVGTEETRLLATAFNKMGDSIQMSQRRLKVMYRSILELFSCNDIDSLLKKAVELACTQCGADQAWFVPARSGREVPYDKSSFFLGLHGWLWKNHRASKLEGREAMGIWSRVEGDRIFPFTLKNQAGEVGTLRVAYAKSPDEATESLLHAQMNLVETALLKQEMIIEGAMVTTELEMAEAVQRNIMAENLSSERTDRIAYHYQPASRLGGDWFYLIEDKKRDVLYVVMGDVTGHGLPQGLITTAVKGALDVIELIIRAHGAEGVSIDGPEAIVRLLDSVVARIVDKNGLTMTCLAASIDFRNHELRLCNAGHTFPILVRSEDAVNVARHLHKNQQPMLGAPNGEKRTHKFESTAYTMSPGDLLIMYTDGLTEAKNLKSEIFGRFLFRSLKRPQKFESAGALKDEILEMFRYYTQHTHLEDDVCFMVVQMDESETQRVAM